MKVPLMQITEKESYFRMLPRGQKRQSPKQVSERSYLDELDPGSTASGH